MKKIIKQIMPKELLYLYTRLRNRYIQLKSRNNQPEELFTEIYKENKWGKDPSGGKYCSGPGTLDSKVSDYKKFLIDFIKEKNVRSIFEIGTGDFRIMESVLSQINVNYIGSDIVKDLVDYLCLNYSNEKISFLHLNAINHQKLPNADLCIIRQVLQHLNNSQIIEILKKTKQYKYVLITEHVPLNPKCKNGDKYLSGGIRLQNKDISGVYLDSEPFSLNGKVIFSYRLDDRDISGRVVPAILQTSLIENIKRTTANII